MRTSALKHMRTLLTRYVHVCVRTATGRLAQAVRSVVGGAVERALAVVRPPGHHAVCERAMGFCIFNNVAVAVRDALATQGERREGWGWGVVITSPQPHTKPNKLN